MKFVFVCSLLLSSTVFAKGVFPDSITIKGKKLVNNGEGLREHSVFGLDIYTAALFLEKKESDANKIMKSPGIKVIKMGYHYDVPKDKIVPAWKTSFKNQCGDCKDMQEEIKKFLATEKDCPKQTTRTISLLPDRTVVYHNKEKLYDGGPKMAKLILGTWLGANPPSEDLKKGMLGLK